MRNLRKHLIMLFQIKGIINHLFDFQQIKGFVFVLLSEISITV